MHTKSEFPRACIVEWLTHLLLVILYWLRFGFF
jgi:hypothetical protein